MRYGICTDINNAEILKRSGFDYIEINVTKIVKLTEQERREEKSKLDELGIRAEAASVLFPKTVNIVDGTWKDEDFRGYLEEAFDCLQFFETEVVVFGSGKARMCHEGLSFKKAYKRLVDALRITGEIAGKHGMKIAIEALSHAETNMINTLEEGAILKTDADDPHVGQLVDYFHVMRNNDLLTNISVIRDFNHMHIAANDGRKYPLSNEGEQYRGFFNELKKIGYDGRMSIEGKTENMEKDAKTALEFMKSLERGTL